MRFLAKIIFGVTLISAFEGLTAPLSFTYQGRLSDSNNAPQTGSFDFKIQIFDSSGTCLLYEEKQSSISLDSNGMFNLQIGSDVTSSKRGVGDPGLTMYKVFSNEAELIRNPDAANCPAGYTSASTDKRKMKISIANLNSGVVTVLSPMQEITMTPFALNAGRASDAAKLQGKEVSEFIVVDGSSTRANIKSLTDKVTEILAMVSANVSNKFQSFMADYQGSGRISVSDSPVANTDAINKNYADNRIAGREVAAAVKAPVAGDDGKVLTWSNAQNKYILQTPASSSSNLTSSDITSALGYTPMQPNAELSAISNLALTGILQRTSGGNYTALGTSAPLNVAGGNIGISVGSGLTLSAGSLVPDFGTTTGKVAAGDDSRIVNAIQAGDARLPSSNCASGSFNRWNGSAWVCESDQTSSGSGTGLHTISEKSADYSVQTSDEILLGDSSSGPINMTLPNAVGNSGRVFTFKKMDAGPHTLYIKSSGGLIEGGSSGYLHSKFNFASLVSNGVDWLVVSSNTDLTDSKISTLLHFNNSHTDSSVKQVTYGNTGSVGFSNSIYKYGTHSAVFTGTNYISSTNSAVVSFAGDYTMECWAYVSAYSAGSGYLLGNQGVGQISIAANGEPRVNTGAGTIIAGSAGAVALNTWYHLAMVRKGSTLTLYLNGVAQGTATVSGAVNFGTLYVGTASTQVGNATYGFNGYVDEVRISTKAQYDGNFTPPTQEFNP